MKRSASKAELSSEQEEALEPTQAGLGFEQGNVGEGSAQAASVAVLQLTQAAQRGAIHADSGVAVQPMQAVLGLESHSFQEQSNVEERGVIAVQTTQANSRLQSHISQEQPNMEERFLQANMVQPTQAALPNLLNLEGISMDDFHDLVHPSIEEHAILEEVARIVTGQVEASHQEEEAGINDRIVPQAPPFDVNNLRSGQVEASQQEAAPAGINDRIVPQAPPFDVNNQRNVSLVELADLEEPIDGEEDTGVQARTHSQQMQNLPPQQGTARRRMRLQVRLGGAKELSELQCVSIASSERTCMGGGMSLEQEAKSLPTEPARHATCSSARGTMGEETHTKEPLCAEGSSGSSSTSLVHLPLGILGDAFILHAFTESSNENAKMNFGSEDGINGSQSMMSYQNNTRPYLQQRLMPSSSIKEAEISKRQHELAQAVSDQECRKPCMGCGSGRLALCLFWIATLALICLCLFRSFCRLTRTAFTSV